MKSKTSFFNATIFKKNISHYWPVWVVFLCYLIFLLPVRIWSDTADYQSYYAETGMPAAATQYQVIGSVIRGAVMPIPYFIFALVAALVVFSYLYNARTANTIHALPVNRFELFVTNYISGILFLIDMDNRELYISTNGQMIRYMTDSRIDDVLDDVYNYAADADYYGAAAAFLTDTEKCYSNGISRDQYNYDTETGKISRYHHLEWYEILIALGVAALCGGAAVASVLRSYSLHGEDKRMAANFKLSYRRDSRFTMGNVLADALLTSYITQQVIQTQKNRPSSGGGSFSGGGRSSTHSYGGSSRGGGGRKF